MKICKSEVELPIMLEVDDIDCAILIGGYMEALQEAVDGMLTCAEVRNWPDWELAVAELELRYRQVGEMLAVHRNICESQASAEEGAAD